MAEACTPCDSEERDGSKSAEDDELPAFRTLCEHYSRGCSFIVNITGILFK